MMNDEYLQELERELTHAHQVMRKTQGSGKYYFDLQKQIKWLRDEIYRVESQRMCDK